MHKDTKNYKICPSYTKTGHLVYEPPEIGLSYTKTGHLVYESAKLAGRATWHAP